MKKNIHHINIIKSATLAIIVNFDDGDKFELHVKEFYLHLDKNSIILFNTYFICLFH